MAPVERSLIMNFRRDGYDWKVKTTRQGTKGLREQSGFNVLSSHAIGQLVNRSRSDPRGRRRYILRH